jgi:hypothetical protein
MHNMINAKEPSNFVTALHTPGKYVTVTTFPDIPTSIMTNSVIIS